MSRPALEINAANDKAHYFRGLAYFYKSLYDKAVADCNRCVELDSKLADPYFNKALALETAGRREGVREAYAAFLRHTPREVREQIEQAKGKVGRR